MIGNLQPLTRLDSSSFRENCEKRIGQSPIPLNLSVYTNEEQAETLKSMCQFGWDLAFVRRPKNQPSTIVVKTTDGTSYGVIMEDGTINTHTDIKIR